MTVSHMTVSHWGLGRARLGRVRDRKTSLLDWQWYTLRATGWATESRRQGYHLPGNPRPYLNPTIWLSILWLPVLWFLYLNIIDCWLPRADCLKVHSIFKSCQYLIHLITDKNVIKMKNHRKNNKLDHLVKGGEKVFYSACVVLACALGGSIMLMIAALIAQF